MINLPRPSPHTLDRAREIFGDLAAVDALMQPSRTARKRLPASALYATARLGEDDDDVVEELTRNRHARGLQAHVMAQTAPFALGALRAASSGGASERHGDGCHIRIERSRAEPDQFFVVVQVLRTPPSGRAPTSLIVYDREDHCQRFPLPTMRDGIAQFIADSGSELMRLMDDPTTRVFLG